MNSGPGWLADERRALCLSNGIVQPRSARLSAITLIVAILVATGSTLIAQSEPHAACAVNHHECGHTATITTPCCCGHATDASHEGGPVESRVRLTVDLSSLPVVPTAGTFADTSASNLQVDTALPSGSLPDLATRFAPLLI